MGDGNAELMAVNKIYGVCQYLFCARRPNNQPLHVANGDIAAERHLFLLFSDDLDKCHHGVLLPVEYK